MRSWCQASAPWDLGEATPDAGTPPERCIAPCVWELMKHCPHHGSCTRQPYPGGAVGPNEVSCAPAEHWWKITVNGDKSDVEHYYVDDCLCYGYRGALLPSSTPWQIVEEWSDSAGNPVATGLVDANTRAGPVVCAPFDVIAKGGAKDAPSYDVDPTLPECALWIEPQCKEGNCPADPPEVPVSPY